MRDTNDRLGHELDEAKKRLKQHEETYAERLRLEAPVTYGASGGGGDHRRENCSRRGAGSDRIRHVAVRV